MRRGLKQILAETKDIVLAGEATNGHETLDLVRQRDWDVLVLDIIMAGRSGLDILKDIRPFRTKLPVLVLAMHAEKQFAARMFNAGADGYLNKESAPEQLVKAIYRVHGGGKYISPTHAERLVGAVTGGHATPRHETLSDREFEIFCLLTSDKTVSQIAVQLSLSVKTASTYRARILEKMRMKTNAELTHYAIRTGLVD